MTDDYRNTKYCPKLYDLSNKKSAIKSDILSAHSRAKDMHTYISKNDDSYKQQFIEAYNGKCAYCGTSIKIVPLKMFEIDHFIPKEAARFDNSKAKAGYIENLVLACYDCNRNKSDFECPDEDQYKIHPDYNDITASFVRDDEFYIRVSDEMKDDKIVNLFYQQVGLGNQLHRIDFLLLNMLGLCERITDKHPAYGGLMGAIVLLQQKRNGMR